jgi:hypothetical protein
MANGISMNKIQEHWKNAFPDRWERLVEIATPFYSDHLNFDLKPARLTAELELRNAMDKIAPGDAWKTPLGKRKKEKDTIFDFSSTIKKVELVTKLPSRCSASAFRNIVHNHVGSFIDDKHCNLHPAFHGSSNVDPFNLGNRIDQAFKKSVYATWPISEGVNPADISPITLSVFAGNVSSILFMGLHFASVGDSSRDFYPLLKFLLSGNYPVSTKYSKPSKGVSSETDEALCSILLLCR